VQRRKKGRRKVERIVLQNHYAAQLRLLAGKFDLRNAAQRPPK
jgi:hypothetical protein